MTTMANQRGKKPRKLEECQFVMNKLNDRHDI